MDYRSSYRVVGRAVSIAIDENRTSLTNADVARAAVAILGRSLDIDSDTVVAACDPWQIVESRSVLGGSSPERVREHCHALADRLEAADRWRDMRRTDARLAEDRLIAAARKLRR